MKVKKSWTKVILGVGLTLALCILLIMGYLQAAEMAFSRFLPTQTPCPTYTCTPDPSAPRIAFASNRFKGGQEIFLMNKDGTCVTQLTYFLDWPFDSAEAIQPLWSPDGTHILFERFWPDDRDLYLMTAQGKQVRRLTWEGKNFAAKWSPDGSYIAFKSDRSGQIGLYVMAADGSGQRQVTDVRLSRYGIDSLVRWNYDWSPDGQRLIFTGEPPGEEQMEVYIVKLDGSDLRNLTQHPSDDEVVAWWPQENKLLFRSNRKLANYPEVEDWLTLYQLNPDGSGLQRIVDLIYYVERLEYYEDYQILGWTPTTSKLELILYSERVHILDVACALANPPGPGVLPEGCYHSFSVMGNQGYWSAGDPQLTFRFVDTNRSSAEIVVANYDGTGVTNLTSCSPHDTDPAWSPAKQSK